MGRAVSVSLQKGGVGKTTIAINLADALANRGHDVLLVDLDQQGNATEGVGLKAAYERDSPHVVRSEERRVGKECLRLCRSRWSPYH